MLERLRAVAALSLALLALVFAPRAEGSVARAVTLRALVTRSALVATCTPLEATSRWENVGGRRRIVTDTRVRVDRRVAGEALGGELIVRTLGGQVGEVGQVVSGEAVLIPGEASLLFFTRRADGQLAVTALAQGQFRLAPDAQGVVRLHPSPWRATLVDARDSAARALAGRALPEATRLIEEAARAK
ncbi:MAG: hypothetical protein OZ921_21555 [Sorangiineae bacterium]|nr:hypothetical protein [Polyangiaceae bacterium]MEB2325115.1 hypothetical protein [Sorangiineae bacterium]